MRRCAGNLGGLPENSNSYGAVQIADRRKLTQIEPNKLYLKPTRLPGKERPGGPASQGSRENLFKPMSQIPVSSRGVKTFSEWQPIYAERGITLIPCGPNKAPLVKNPQKFGRDASAVLAGKFSDAGAFGYYCGRRNGITVLDVDTTDERVLADAMNRHGQTPIVVRTGSGKFHALYRHNSERRSVRAWDGLPIDLLGEGLAIAPPSVVAKGEYRIIQGHLDDTLRTGVRNLTPQL